MTNLQMIKIMSFYNDQSRRASFPGLLLNVICSKYSSFEKQMQHKLHNCYLKSTAFDIFLFYKY